MKSALATIERSVPRLGLSVDDLAMSLGVSPTTIRKMVEEGALPRPRIWHSRRIWRTAEIDAAMAEWPTDGQSDDEVAASNEWRADE